MNTFTKKPRIQGEDSIVIEAPVSVLWPLIQDSRNMELWGPPVNNVEIELLPDQQHEGEGSKRKVFATFSERRKGWYHEVRTHQIEGKSVTFRIDADSFGISRMLDDVGATMELEELTASTTRFIFTFYHRPKGFLGRLMNPIIRFDQKKNRRKALRSIKSFAETGKAIKN